MLLINIKQQDLLHDYIFDPIAYFTRVYHALEKKNRSKPYQNHMLEI